jgi:alpha-beta hydrolase superfamily lysophospholipase
VLLAGHSTGGLIASLYAHEGERRSDVRGLWLNSPFFDWKVPDLRRPQLHIAAAMGRYAPFLKNPESLRPEYVQGLLAEWEFDTRLKPVRGFPVYFGWIAAINDAHAKVHRGLAIACPVLAMHSDEADWVLDWRHIARWSRNLGPDVAVLAFPGAVHDLVLSRREIRDEVFSQLFAWAERVSE